MAWVQNGKKLSGVKSYTIQEYQGGNIATFNFGIDSESYIIIAGTGEYPPYLMVFSNKNFTINFPWGTYSPSGTTPYEGVDYYYYSVIAYCSRENDFFINDNATIITRPNYTSLLEYVTSHYVVDTPTFDLDVYTLGNDNTLTSLVWSNLQNPVEGVNYRILVECKGDTLRPDYYKVGETEWGSGSMQVDFIDLVTLIPNYGDINKDSIVNLRVDLFSYSDVTVERIIYDEKHLKISYNGSITGEDTENHEHESVTNDDNYNDDTSVWISPHRPSVEENLDNLMTTSYKITSSNLRGLATELWQGEFGTNIEQLQNDPMENIISIKTLPFEVTTSGTSNITIGNVTTDIQASIVTDNHKFPKNGKLTITVPKKSGYPDFLNYAPYTGVSIYLPFIGVRDLDTNLVMGQTLGIQYIYDISTATCVACLYVNDTPIDYFEGSCGIDLPLSAVNRAQVELQQHMARVNGTANLINSTVSAIGNAAMGNVSGFVNNLTSLWQGTEQANADINSAQFHTTTKGSIGSQLINFIPNECYLIIERPRYVEPSTYSHDYGYPCHLACTLGNLSGFTQVSHTVELDNIPCTEQERNELRALLMGGVYL